MSRRDPKQIGESTAVAKLKYSVGSGSRLALLANLVTQEGTLTSFRGKFD